MPVDLFRAELSDAIDDTGELQLLKKLQGYAGEEFTGVHRVQPFGFHSMPPVGSHGIGLALRGMRDLVVALGLEHPEKRPKNRDSGSTAIYDQWGNIVSLVEKEIRVVHTKKLHVVAPEILFEGDLKVTGKMEAGKWQHTHGGVMKGGDNTDKPDQGIY